MSLAARCILSTALLLTAAPATWAAPPSLLLKGGLSIAGVSGDFVFIEPESKLGFAGAVALEVPLTGRLSVAPELGYAMRGFSFGETEPTDPFGDPAGTFESLYAVDYFTITAPVSLAFPSGRFGFTLSTGPQVAVKVSEALVLTGALDEKTDGDILTDTDIGWLVGAGADLGFGSGRLGLEARYIHGLTNLNGVGPEDFSSRNFEILATWKFPLGH